MKKQTSKSRTGGYRLSLRMVAVVTTFGLGITSVPTGSLADEGGVSFWLPGIYGSLAAVPQAAPGWAFYTFNYYTNVSAGGRRGGRARS